MGTNGRKELIEGRFELHDRHQFEVKLDYTIDPKIKENRYRIEAYFFVPRNLGVTELTYSRQQFYKDIQAHIRFKTPSVSLSALLSPTNKASPLNKVLRRLPKVQKDPTREKRVDRVSYELRLLACLVRVNMRERVLSLLKELGAAQKKEECSPDELQDSVASIESLLGDLDPLLQKLRSLRASFHDPVMPLDLRESYDAVDEYISGNVEFYLTILLEEIDKDERVRQTLTASRDSIREHIVAEQRYRKSHEYPTLLDPQSTNELFVYRSSTLKKFVMSVLFLKIKKEEDYQHAADMLAAAAAGAAMLFATVAMVIGAQHMAADSVSFVAAAVVVYMLKDRIKDWLKRYFGAKFSPFLWDYGVHIRDPATGTRLGLCRESFAFTRLEEVPPEVINLRHSDHRQAVLEESYPDVILRYWKEVRLDSETITSQHERMHDINDIIRFKVSSLLVRSDDPHTKVHAYDADQDAVRVHDCAKVYHINVVFVLRAFDENKPPHFTRVRVIVDKNGIRRLEEVQ